MNTTTVHQPSPAPVNRDAGAFYVCAICQSLAPFHACVITPERGGICGKYTWQSARAYYEKEPYGPFTPLDQGEPMDAGRGQWRGINDYFNQLSGGRIKRVNLYSLLREPATACVLAEAVTAVLPAANGVVAADRGYRGETPLGLTFGGLLDVVRGGEPTPGFAGHAKSYITAGSYLQAEGGIIRLVWLPARLKKDLRRQLAAQAAALGMPEFPDKIADETVGTTEQAILPFLRAGRHPALSMSPILE